MLRSIMKRLLVSRAWKSRNSCSGSPAVANAIFDVAVGCADPAAISLPENAKRNAPPSTVVTTPLAIARPNVRVQSKLPIVTRSRAFYNQRNRGNRSNPFGLRPRCRACPSGSPVGAHRDGQTDTIRHRRPELSRADIAEDGFAPGSPHNHARIPTHHSPPPNPLAP